MSSVKNEGTAIVVTLYLKLADGAEDEHRQSDSGNSTAVCVGHTGSEACESSTQTDFAGCKCLLAEDNELNAEIAIEILESMGIKVELAENGEEAVRKFLKQPDYDVIFLDIQMPKMNGYDAARTIRNAGYTAIPIIAMTANAFADDVQAAKKAGMNEHVSKPINVKHLKAVLETYLRRN